MAAYCNTILFLALPQVYEVAKYPFFSLYYVFFIGMSNSFTFHRNGERPLS